MTRRLLLIPDGWPCELSECPPGPFVHPATEWFANLLCFKSEYMDGETGKIIAYNSAGEFYCGEGLVQPVRAIFEDSDDDG